MRMHARQSLLLTARLLNVNHLLCDSNHSCSRFIAHPWLNLSSFEVTQCLWYETADSWDALMFHPLDERTLTKPTSCCLKVFVAVYAFERSCLQISSRRAFQQ